MSTRTALSVLALFVVTLLGACGGGGDSEEDGGPTHAPVDCKANPKVCV